MTVRKPVRQRSLKQATEVERWIKTNVKRWKKLRLVTHRDIGRKMGTGQEFIYKLLNEPWEHSVDRLQAMRRALVWYLQLCEAMGVTLPELFSRPDDFSVLQEDGEKVGKEIARKKKKLKLTQEQQARQALLESLGLDEG